MVFKLINATDVKEGINIIIDGAPCIVKGIDISKTGKHGAPKVRIEAIGIIDGKKRIVIKPGHERFEIPMIEKRKAQVLSITGEKASVMDLESYETLEIQFPEELKPDISEGKNIEYWNIEGKKIIKRLL